MRPLVVAPNVEALVCAYLGAVPEVTALVDPRRVTVAAPPNETFAKTLLQVTVIGGGFGTSVDHPSVQLDSYGPDKSSAERLATTAFAALLAADADVTQYGTLASAAAEMRPQWLPDETVTPPTPRYVMRVRLNTHN